MQIIVQSYILSEREIAYIKNMKGIVDNNSHFSYIQIDINEVLNNFNSSHLPFQYLFGEQTIYFFRPILRMEENLIIPTSTFIDVTDGIAAKYFPILISDDISVNENILRYRGQFLYSSDRLIDRLNTCLQEKNILYQYNRRFIVGNLTLEEGIKEVQNMGLNAEFILKFLAIGVIQSDFRWAKILCEEQNISLSFVKLIKTQKIELESMSELEKNIAIFYLIAKIKFLGHTRKGKNDPFGLRQDARNILILSLFTSHSKILYLIRENLELITQHFGKYDEIFKFCNMPIFPHLFLHFGNENLRNWIDNSRMIHNWEIIYRIKKFIRKHQYDDSCIICDEIPIDWKWIEIDLHENTVNQYLNHINDTFNNIFIADSQKKIDYMGRAWNKLKIFLGISI